MRRSSSSAPVYWALMSSAAYKALFQLLRPSRRHYWELTEHGLVGEQDRPRADTPVLVAAPSAAASPAASA